MIRNNNDSLNGAIEVGSDGANRRRYVDIHCHCLPAVDDGPATMSESLALCRALVNDGMATVVATPHQLGRFSGCNDAPQIREAVSVLNEELRSSNIPLVVMPGADVRVDERICQLLEADKVLTLADGGKYILLELPSEVFIDIEPLLSELAFMNVRAVISHPERHGVLAKQPQILLKWLEHSAYLQITAGSLLGDFGIMPQRAAWHLLNSGIVSLVATDAHNLEGRRPCMGIAFERIRVRQGEGVANLVCVENPRRILEGQDVESAFSTSTRKCSDGQVPDSYRQF